MSTLYYPVYKLHFLSQLSKKRLSQDFYSSSKALICFFGVTPRPFRLSTLLITLPRTFIELFPCLVKGSGKTGNQIADSG